MTGRVFLARTSAAHLVTGEFGYHPPMLVRTLVLASTALPYRQFKRSLRDPEKAQQRAWRRIWTEIGDSPMWRQYAGRDGSPTLSRFPISSYDDYAAAIERSFESGISELSGKPVIFWLKTSGTTGDPKYYPHSQGYRREWEMGTRLILHGLARSFPRVLEQPILYLAGPGMKMTSPTGISIGQATNFAYQNIPKFLQRFYALPKRVMADADAYDEWASLYMLATDLTAMIAVTPGQVLAMLDRLRADIDRVWPYLSGHRAPPAPLPTPRVDRARLTRIRQALDAEYPVVTELWPSLQFVSCWKSSVCALQLSRLEPHLRGDVAVIDGTYSATEGVFNITSPERDLGGPINPVSHVVEFSAAGEEPDPTRLLRPWELTEGHDYELLITTSMGLVRYRMFDVVRCTGFVDRTPIIVFQHKSGSTISFGLFRISESQLTSALARAGFSAPGHWFFAPRSEGNGLTLYVDSGSREAAEAHIEAVNRALLAIDQRYATVLDSGLVKPLEVVCLSDQHPVWEEYAHHAQSKPGLLRLAPPRL